MPTRPVHPVLHRRQATPPMAHPMALMGLFLGLTVCASGCLFDREDEKRSPTAIVPLAVGNTWVYNDSVYYERSGGDSVVTDSSLLAITGLRIVGDEANPDTLFLENALRRPNTPPTSTYTYVQNGPQGLYTRGYAVGSDEVFDSVLHVKYPSRTGEIYPTWFVSLQASATAGAPLRVRDSLEIEVVNADTLCTVPAGTFACAHYRGWRPGGVIHADAFYAPGIGYLGAIVPRTQIVNDTVRTVISRRWLARYTLH